MLEIQRPYSMLIGPSAEFMGNRITDIFRPWIYYFIVITAKFRFYKTPSINRKHNAKCVLFVTRDWGKETTLNIDISESLEEFCGEDNFKVLEVLKYDNILEAIEKETENKNYSHIIFDTRIMLTANGLLNVMQSLYRCYFIARLLNCRGVTCLCGMTDLQPGYKLQAELLTSYGGIAISWSDNANGKFQLRHNRFIGPLFTPKSQKTIRKLLNSSLDGIPKSDVAIMGANYEPRKSLVDNLTVWLKSKKIQFYKNTRKDLEAISYLNIYRNSKISFNTNWVVGKKDKYHFVGRNFEITLAGSLLLTQKCQGLDLYLEEGRDYIAFDDFNDLVKKIDYYLSHEEERALIAKSGQQKVLELFNTNFVWNEVNKCLRIHHFREIVNKQR